MSSCSDQIIKFLPVCMILFLFFEEALDFRESSYLYMVIRWENYLFLFVGYILYFWERKKKTKNLNKMIFSRKIKIHHKNYWQVKFEFAI